MVEDYRIWDKVFKYGDSFYNRAIGKTEEMECAKSICEVIKPIYRPNKTLLDVGCGAGHYLRSLRERIDKNINYTGVDITEYYIVKAKEVFKDVRFFIDDIYDLSFKDNSFDIVICNNVVMHLPPPPKKYLSELLRVSSEYVIIRVPIGKRNYIIKEVKDHNDNLNKDELKHLKTLIKDDGKPALWNYLNIYTKEYLEEAVLQINPDYVVTFIPDNKFSNFKSTENTKTSTTVIDGRQVSGNIILDYYFMVVKK
jgi:ubiquinone/menaquinone biosynthesis C-methylase UbiE